MTEPDVRLTCPYCGRVPEERTRYRHKRVQYAVRCSGCGSGTVFCSEEGRAWSLWNARHAEEGII